MASDSPSPRFLLESGTYQIDNIGDIAMLQVAVQRIKARWPGSHIDVVTEQPERLKRVLPEVEPMPASSWFRQPIVPVPGFAKYWNPTKRLRWWERRVGPKWPRLANAGKQWHAKREPDGGLEKSVAFYEALRQADAVICTGGGFLNDFYHEHAFKVLTTLQAAQGLGKHTAIFGVGLGPWTRHDLKEIAGPTIRDVDALSLRDQRLSLDVAREIAVEDRKRFVTGDDAIALAHAAKDADDCAGGRHGLGVNVRLSADAEVDRALLPALGKTLQDLAGEHDAPLVPLVIRTADSPINDVESARLLLGSGLDLTVAEAVRTPADAFEQIARCKVVVTGAYHNAVFALSMGIPVVALATGDYYLAKMNGVADMFGLGMTVLDYRDAKLLPKLRDATQRAWAEAQNLRVPLRDAARDQIGKADTAYEALFSSIVAAFESRQS